MSLSSDAKALQQVEFGGVDSRSNPLNMPRNRALRNLNWTVKPGGWLELRQGYSIITQSTVVAGTITGLVPYTKFDQTRFVLKFIGTTPYQVAISDGTVTGPTFGTGAAMTSAARGQSYQYNNRLYYGNGTDQLYFDGTTWRASGLRALTTTEVGNTAVFFGAAGELTPTQRAAVTVTQTGTGGNFPVQTFSGMYFYVSTFNPTYNELSPATQPVGNGSRTQIAVVNSKVTLAGLPDESAAGPALKLVSRTDDGAGAAYFCTTAGPVAIQTITRAGAVVTVNATAHGRATNDVIVLAGAGDSNYNGVWSITVVNANQFTFTMLTPGGAVGPAAGGTLAPILTVAAATLTVDVTSTLRDLSIITNDPNRGIATSTIGGPNPGFQFYLSIARVVSGVIIHVGNRMPIGLRIVPTTRSNIRLFNLPTLADPELQLLVGRTGDGLQVPYASVDTAGNFLLVPNGVATVLVATNGTIDGNSELPFRSFIIPATCDKFAVVGDYVYAADSISPTIRRCGSALKFRNGQFLGDVAQAWDPVDIETFPTNQTTTAMAETDGLVFIATRTDCGFLVDNLGTLMWIGPYTKGCAGARAFIKTDHGFFWVSWDLELCTIIDGKPMAVSDEYNAGELSLLGDAFKSTIELQYFRSRTLDKDELVIYGQKADGTPHQVKVDFKLADGRSMWGQASGEEYQGPLGTVFTTASVIDANSVRRVWTGATDGNIYQTYAGNNDLGTEYVADTLFLLPTGLERPQCGYIDIFGDGNLQVGYGRQLNATLDQGLDTDLTVLTSVEAAPMQVPGRDDLVAWRIPTNDPELLGHVYLRLQLTSHSTDGTLALSSPPHVPVESYGRVYLVAPLVGEERGRA